MKQDNILLELIKIKLSEAEMRQGCSNQTPHAEIFLGEIQAHYKQNVVDIPKLRGEIEPIIDNTLSMEALIVFNFAKKNVEAMKAWSDNQMYANYNLRESTIKKLLSLFTAKVGEVVKAERERIGRFIKKNGFNNQDVDNLISGQALKDNKDK